jgi:ferredoxin
MKKVGIVSCYFKNNYGSMLQAYATKKILDNNNIPNETVNIDGNVDFKNGKKKYYMTQIFNFNFIKSKLGMIKMKFDIKLNKKLGKNVSIRNKKYKEFRNEFNLSRSSNTYKDLSKLAEERYSDILLGSDQLWLPVNVVADYYTLNWVPDNVNKISYSTSFGVSSIPQKYNDLYKKFLNRIDHLSVREDTGVKIVKEIVNKKAELVCDPTILLNRDEWDEVATKERIIKEKYILCYFLGKNIEHRKFAERLKEKTGYKIVSLNHADEYVKYSDVFADITPYDVGPREWINLVKNAEIVCTDSFHGTVFSLIYNKAFFNFRRYSSKAKGSTNSRLDSLLKIVDVSSERILTGLEDVEEVLKYKLDFEKVNQNLEKYRNDSKKWLLEAITWKDENIKHINITSKEDCCGCTACMNKCPKNAIKMVEDKEGFLYPQVDKEKCVDCGICKKVCPIINKPKERIFEQKAYIFQNEKEEVRRDSTSGGFFSSIGENVIKNNGVCFGAAFDENFVVEHQEANKLENLKKFRKSKYVQSNLGDVFKKIEKYLKESKTVLFSGTPCQVAGLSSYLGKEYENLILVDIMCHSVPSPLFFEKYKEYILKKLNAKKILSINFRDKSRYGYKYSMMTVKTDNGVYSEGIDTDPYLRAFFGDYSIRPSCYNCQFKTKKRISDITIWDCFNINEIDKSFDDDKGTTRILVQSKKGEEVLKKLENVKVKEIKVDFATAKVKEMTKSVRYNFSRIEFFNDIDEKNLFEKWFPKNIKTKMNGGIRKFLCITGLYSNIKSKAKKILKR